MQRAPSGTATGPDAAPTPSGAVDCSVWWASARWDVALIGLLTDAERRHLAALGSSEDRERYLTGRALVRSLLAAHTGARPEQLPFETSCHRCGGKQHGKPRLVGLHGNLPVAFNLAHGGDRVVVALTNGPEVGVDVEVVPELDARQLAALSADFLSATERLQYGNTLPSHRARAFAIWWTRKEAVLKATGVGLAVPPSYLTVTDPGSCPAVIGWHPRVRWPSGAAPPIQIRDLDSRAGVVGAVAVLDATRLRLREHSGDRWLDVLADRARPSAE